nr:methyl-accepting chemotaxis protein [Alkalispirochaeta alkalica]
MKNGGSGSLLRKIVLVQVACVFVIMAAVGVRDYRGLTLQTRRQMEENAEFVVERVANGLGPHMWNYAHDAAAVQLAADLVARDVLGFVVQEGDSLWMAVAQDGEGQLVRLEAEQDIGRLQEQAALDRTRPVYHNEQELGSVKALFTDEPLRVELARQRRRTILNTLMIGFVLSVTLSLALRTMVVKPLRSIVLRLRDIAEGEADLTQQLTIRSKDEVGEFASLFNRFVETIRGLAANIKFSVNQTAATSSQVEEQSRLAYGATENISSGVGEIQTSFEGLSGDIDEATAAVEQILGNIHELRNTIQSETAAVTESSASIEELLSTIRNISSSTDRKAELAKVVQGRAEEGDGRINDTTAVVREIGADVGQMTEIVDVINGITAQTNLLAMNAAIEAAHAGESGRGFAVVAEEIRKLAESTSENSKVITETLRKVVERIRRLEETSEHTAEVFQEIRSGVQEVFLSFSEISSSMSEMKDGTDSINEAMVLLNNMSHQVQGGADEMQRGAETINKSMQKISSVSGDVGDRIATVKDESQAIFGAMESILSLVDDNQKRVRLLKDETARFKTDSEPSPEAE